MVVAQERLLRIGKDSYFFDIYIPEKQSVQFSTIFLGGATRSKSEYEHLGRYAAERGCLICVADMPGHGKTTSEFSTEDTIHYITELSDFLKGKPYNSKAVVAGGYSLGARMALQYAATRHNGISGAYFVTVPRDLPRYMKIFSKEAKRSGMLIRQNGTTRYRSFHTRDLDAAINRFCELEDPIDIVNQISVPTLFIYGADFHIKQSDSYTLFVEMEKQRKDVARKFIWRMHGTLENREMERIGNAVLRHFKKRIR